MLHLCFIGSRGTLCIFPISQAQGSTGRICSLSPSHQLWTNPCCCPVSRESLRYAGLSQWFKPSYLRMWWISSARSPQPGADGYLRDMLQLKQRERCLIQELQGQAARPVLCGRSGKVSWHFKPVHLHCKSWGCLQEDDRHKGFNGKHSLFLFVWAVTQGFAFPPHRSERKLISLLAGFAENYLKQFFSYHLAEHKNLTPKLSHFNTSLQSSSTWNKINFSTFQLRTP